MTQLPDPTSRPTVSVDDAAAILGVARVTAYEAVHAGQIPSIRVGRRILVPTAALRRLLGLDEPAEEES
jgi:excisionase family DNA binding protein